MPPRPAARVVCVAALISLGLSLGISVLAQNHAVAQAPLAPDTSACPTHGTAAAANADPLTGPEAEDDYTEPTEPEVEAPAAAAAAAPNADLKPAVRTPNSVAANVAAGGLAAHDVMAPKVYLGLIRWCVIEPENVTPTNGKDYHWEDYDALLDAYRNFTDPETGLPSPISIETMKLTDAPNWAVTSTCRDLAQRNPPDVDKCPPRAGKEDDLKAFAEALAQHYGPRSPYSVDRVSFWNEPDLPRNWGEKDFTPDERRAAARRYSDLLARVYHGATLQGPGPRSRSTPVRSPPAAIGTRETAPASGRHASPKSTTTWTETSTTARSRSTATRRIPSKSPRRCETTRPCRG